MKKKLLVTEQDQQEITSLFLTQSTYRNETLPFKNRKRESTQQLLAGGCSETQLGNAAGSLAAQSFSPGIAFTGSSLSGPFVLPMSPLSFSLKNDMWLKLRSTLRHFPVHRSLEMKEPLFICVNPVVPV